MFTSRRQRRGSYAMASRGDDGSGLIGAIVVLVLAGIILYGLLRLFLWVSSGDAQQHTPAQVRVERGGAVNVTIDGGAVQQAEDGLPLYPGDAISTSARGHVELTFFDGTTVRMDEDSELKILESEQGTDASIIQLQLSRGRLWVNVPSAAAFSGAVARSVSTPAFELALPTRTQATVSLRQTAVYESDGLGVTLTVPGVSTPVVVGEGQSLTLPTDDSDVGDDLYDFRAPLDDAQLHDPFVEESRGAPAGSSGSAGSAGSIDTSGAADGAIDLVTPAKDELVTTETVLVSGTVGAGIDRVRVNGYQAAFDAERRTFRQEIAVSGDGPMEIRVEGLNEKGIVQSEVSRSIRASRGGLPPPTITAPAAGGQTYRTQATEITIRGNAPSWAQAILVNDYQLQLYKPGNTTWSYLARTDLNNYHEGRNVYNVVAVGKDNERGKAATLVILLEAGPEGVVGTGAVVGGDASSSSVSSVNEATLPMNPPLTPGSLAVTGPTPGTTHTATGSEILIEGTTSAGTDSIWVNGYKLQLYRPGKTYWNYIAKEEFANLKKGTNVYRIVARDKDGQILDAETYTVTY